MGTQLTPDHTPFRYVTQGRVESVFRGRSQHGTPREASGSMSMQPVVCTPWCSTDAVALSAGLVIALGRYPWSDSSLMLFVRKSSLRGLALPFPPGRHFDEVFAEQDSQVGQMMSFMLFGLCYCYNCLYYSIATVCSIQLMMLCVLSTDYYCVFYPATAVVCIVPLLLLFALSRYCFCLHCPVIAGVCIVPLLLVFALSRYCWCLHCPVTAGVCIVPLLLVFALSSYCWCLYCPITAGVCIVQLLLVIALSSYCCCLYFPIAAGVCIVPLLLLFVLFRYYCLYCPVIAGVASPSA